MILIIDFGSQTTHLIKRRVTDLGVQALIINEEDLEQYLDNSSGIILSGGPASVYSENSPTLHYPLEKIKVPVLGICYGWQLIAKLLGGKVEPGNKEYGPTTLHLTHQSPLTTGIKQKSLKVWMSHGDTVSKLPKDFVQAGHTDNIQHALAINSKQKIFGLQFHPEVEHTDQGTVILKNFLKNICKLTLNPKVLNVEDVVNKTKEQLSNTKGTIIAAISGGVDSTVATAITAKAVGKRVVPIYCNNGLMRLGTKEQVLKIFQDQLGIEPIIVECQDRFLKKLKGITSPEKKRQVIGKLYIDIFEEEANKLKNVEFLIQGTIYSDVIESKGTRHADKIKSHHNVGGLPDKMNLKLVEPLHKFYKDEVRELGKQLGLPNDVVNCQPFPGPGHAIRILGEVTKQRLTKQQQADKIVVEVLKETGWFDKVFQCFPIMTGVKTTSAKGDGRVYAELVGLRIYDSSDIMTAGWSRLPYEVLQRLSSRIVNEVPDVSRVAYDITTKPPATMEWE